MRPGLYTNTVTVEARADNGGPTADTAENRHAGSTIGITIKKAVNAVNELAPTIGEEADEPTGPALAVGTHMKWTYRVTTTTTTPLANVVVIDDNGTPDFAGDDFSPTLVSGDTNGNGLLESGEIWLYRAFGTAVSGQYTNIGSATATQGTTPVAGRRTRRTTAA